MAMTKVTTEPAEIKAAKDTAEQVSPHQDRSQPATPDREAKPRKAALQSPAAPKPSSPISTEQHQTVDIGEMEWPQLAPTIASVAHESSRREQSTVEHDKTGEPHQVKETSAEVAAKQIEKMMKGLADEDETMPSTVPHEPSLHSAECVARALQVTPPDWNSTRQMAFSPRQLTTRTPTGVCNKHGTWMLQCMTAGRVLLQTQISLRKLLSEPLQFREQKTGLMLPRRLQRECKTSRWHLQFKGPERFALMPQQAKTQSSSYSTTRRFKVDLQGCFRTPSVQRCSK